MHPRFCIGSKLDFYMEHAFVTQGKTRTPLREQHSSPKMVSPTSQEILCLRQAMESNSTLNRAV